MTGSRQVLGRGLAALLQPKEIQDTKDKEFVFLSWNLIHPNTHQPRIHFEEEALEELALSIQEHGILQPLLVKKEGNEYQLIAGERRWRAAGKLGLKWVPCRILEVEENQQLEIALLENIQRQDLSPLEEAKGYQTLLRAFSYTQETLAKKIGKSRSHIANLMRLLQLPDHVQTMIEEKGLSLGHAKAIATANDPERLIEEIVEEKWTVRQTEKKVQHQKIEKRATASLPPSENDGDLLAQQLSQLTGLSVSLLSKKTGYMISFQFSDALSVESFVERMHDVWQKI